MGRFDIEVEGEFVKDMPADGEVTDEKLQAYIGALFREVFDGWGHVITVVHVVAAAYLAPRFITDGA